MRSLFVCPELPTGPMDHTAQILFQLFAILLAAKVGEELFERLGQPGSADGQDSLAQRFPRQSLGRGPKTVPPPFHRGERFDPARARPVPFCRHGFAPPPRTRARVFVEAVPARSFVRCARVA